jgi:hypothetical protein
MKFYQLKIAMSKTISGGMAQKIVKQKTPFVAMLNASHATFLKNSSLQMICSVVEECAKTIIKIVGLINIMI